MLHIKGGQILDANDQVVKLRGTCIGGWMLMENFINGYPGSEHGLRKAFADGIGAEKAAFMFDRWLDHFFADADAAFIKSLGATVVRLSFNYRHFERDDAPFEYLESGFARMDAAIETCARHGLYAILDMHAVPGWQSTNWHSDNSSRHALFWQHKHFQDRWVGLWEEFARRYKGNATVAAYNVMNEPLTDAIGGMFTFDRHPNWEILNAVYRRIVEAIRVIDPDHIIVLEGDDFSKRFEGLDAPFAPNLLYSSHNYSPAGFGPGPYPSDAWNREWQKDMFLKHEGTQYAQRYNVPLWVGEFGSVYNGPAAEVPDRLRAMDDYIGIFNRYNAHWTTWTYKDVGIMGLVTLDPSTPFMQLIAPMLDAKRELRSDLWQRWMPRTPVQDMIDALAGLMMETVDDPEIDLNATRHFMSQAMLAGYIAEAIQPTYVRLFAGKSEEELDDLLSAFAFKNCVVNEGLADILRKHFNAD